MRPRTFHRGISLGLFVSTPDPQKRRAYYETFMDEIHASGATDVSLVVRWAQKDVRANEIAPKEGVSVGDVVLTQVVQMAKDRGLRVFLLPILFLEHKAEGEWRGKLVPSDREAWWRSYRRFIVHYAVLSQKLGIELLSVGSELGSMEGDQPQWRALIRVVRERFEGRLTYSANWDHFEAVEFWDTLDVVGVTAYQELSKSRDPGEEALVKGWKPFKDRLRQWTRRHNRRYIFTEVGYPSNSHAAARPWDHQPKGFADAVLQLRCYRAMYRVWQDDRDLEGLYIWNWFGVGGLEDRGYTPRDKPARFVLENWYQNSLKP